MSFTRSMEFLHVLAAFWFISGVVGRDLTFWQAGKAKDPRSVYTLLQMSEIFERWGVIPLGMAVLVFGLITAWLQQWPIFGVLQGGQSNWLLVSLILFLAGTFVIIPLRLAARRKQRMQAAEESVTIEAITPELNAALHDKVVIRFRIAELIILVVIILLMVMKPI